MNFKVEKKDKEIIVTVFLEVLKKDPKTRIDMNRQSVRRKHVIDYLNKQNIKVGVCTQSDETDNMSGRLESVWKFTPFVNKKLDIAPQPVVSSNKAKRTKKVSKAKDD
tara:strand:+ start:512 stop:835 length:324 start_codon:yes stop_codon:yes gene_type:complete